MFDDTSVVVIITAQDMRTLYRKVLDYDAVVANPLEEYTKISDHIVSSLEGDFPIVTRTIEITKKVSVDNLRL